MHNRTPTIISICSVVIQPHSFSNELFPKPYDRPQHSGSRAYKDAGAQRNATQSVTESSKHHTPWCQSNKQVGEKVRKHLPRNELTTNTPRRRRRRRRRRRSSLRARGQGVHSPLSIMSHKEVAHSERTGRQMVDINKQTHACTETKGRTDNQLTNQPTNQPRWVTECLTTAKNAKSAGVNERRS